MEQPLTIVGVAAAAVAVLGMIARRAINGSFHAILTELRRHTEILVEIRGKLDK